MNDESFLTITTPAGEQRLWTRRVGRSRTRRLLVVHGGPAASHDYLTVLERTLVDNGIEVIFYDQLGGGRSDRPDDDRLWTLDRFVDELEQIRRSYSLGPDDFYLYGHSWGGMLAIEYALTHPGVVKGLVISLALASSNDYHCALDLVRRRMPGSIVEELDALETRGEADGGRYEMLLSEYFYPKHLCRLPVWPDAVVRSFGGINRHVNQLMRGPTALGLSGRLSGWDRTADLKAINVPSLVIAGGHDVVDVDVMRKQASRLPRGRLLVCPEGSHLAMWDDRETYVAGLRDFLMHR
jgi:proline iminopeptidase